MPEGVGFPFPFIAFYVERTYGQPEVVRISLPQMATGLRLRLPGSFRRLVPSAGGAFSQTLLMLLWRHSYAEGAPADTIFF